MIARPALHALLNGTAAVLLIAGRAAARRGRVGLHRALMGTTVLLSAGFLVSYLQYHAGIGHTRYTGTGWIRPVYFTVLISHTVLAAVIVPLVLVTLTWALRGRTDRHRAWARWTWPLWLYVCVTGVAIYFFLY